MKNLEKRISGLIIGSIFPLSLGLLSVTIWFFFDKSESRPLIYLAIGVLTGILIDLKFLKIWINNRFNLPIWIIALIYIVYNFFVYGFFMGIPVLNTFLGLLAGYYFGHRICYKKIEKEKHTRLINHVSMFTGLIMAFICVSSGFLAIYNNGEGMIQDVIRLAGLSFKVTTLILWGIVFIGGFILILTNILLTRIIMIKTIKNHTRLTTCIAND